ncbi:MAG TPA: right-handed parallel beta-helix repeat-containing protein [Longimicrobium sp.]|nr:right-handed parallel beta-helix repeat-containing protein [Longimicrobium sp.]
MTHARRTSLPGLVAAALVGTALLAACDAPTASGGATAAAGAPSMLITPACAGTGGQTHAGDVTTSQTWTRANSPHRVTNVIFVEAGARLTIAPGAVVCFYPGTALYARGGGRLWARGRDTAQVVFTALDPARGWGGIGLYDAPASASYLTNARLEYVHVDGYALTTGHQHAAYVDSAVIRQSGSAVYFGAPGSRLVRSRVDTTTNRASYAVYMSEGSFEQTVVRGAAGIGVAVTGSSVLLAGGRIEGSGGVGLHVLSDSVHRSSRAVRVVGGKAHAADLSLAALIRLYPTPALQDSLAGNARDEVVVGPGTLRSSLTVGSRMRLRIHSTLYVDSAGALVAQPGARMIFWPHTGIQATNGGRVWLRGSAASPVLLTADDPALGWTGIDLRGAAPATSYVTNTRIEHVEIYTWSVAVGAHDNHRVIVDSSVIRQSGRAVHITSPNSRLMRTRVDTILDREFPAVELDANTRIESTRIRASAGPGLSLSSDVVVASCEIVDGDGDAILMDGSVATVRNCNLVNNGGVGIRNPTTGATADAAGNWWGSTDGPLGTGGDGVSGAVVYTPWRTTPFVLPYVPSF